MRTACVLHERLVTSIKETLPGGCCPVVALALSAAHDLFVRVGAEPSAHARTREIGVVNSLSREAASRVG